MSESDKNNASDLQSISCGNLSSFVFTHVFMCYVKSLLLDLPLAPDQLLGLSWKSRSIVMKVHRKFLLSPTISFIAFHLSISIPTPALICHHLSSFRPTFVDILSSSPHISLTILHSVFFHINDALLPLLSILLIGLILFSVDIYVIIPGRRWWR